MDTDLIRFSEEHKDEEAEAPPMDDRCIGCPNNAMCTYVHAVIDMVESGMVS